MKLMIWIGRIVSLALGAVLIAVPFWQTADTGAPPQLGDFVIPWILGAILIFVPLRNMVTKGATEEKEELRQENSQ